MTSSTSRRPRLALLAAPLVAALLLSGCGGSNADPAPAASPTPTPSGTTTTTPTPSPTPTPAASAPASPVADSPFEDRAPVRAARKWAAALGRAVTRHDGSLKGLRSTTTAAGRTVSAQLVSSDLEKKYTWPGPQPFTPVHVATDGPAATIDACYLTRGWSVDPATGDRVTRKKVEPARMSLVREGGAWKVDGLFGGKADCGGVKVAEVTW